VRTVEKCSAIILAGGRATRLGGINKGLIEVGGVPVVRRVLEVLRPLSDQIILAGRSADDLAGLGAEIVPDAFQPGSALVGLYSALSAARHDAAIAVACDMPFLSTRLLAYILEQSGEADVTVPRIGPHLEALHAVYRRACLPVMRDMVESGNHKIIDFYERVKVREIDEAEMRALDPDLLSVFNINTPADAERAHALVASH
jgi:molybdenum cofactor guanylyltransferase